MTSAPQKPVRIGEILIKVGLLTDKDLDEAAQVAVDLGLPLGKVLVMSGYLSDAELQAVVQIQSMLKDQVITIEQASAAMQLVKKDSLAIEQALREIGWVAKEIMQTNKLGELLIDAGICDVEQLNAALTQAHESGLPLGRILVLTQKLPESLIYSCLNAQILLRDGKITREQAISGLKAAYTRQLSLEQALMDQGSYRPPSTQQKIRLGQIFVLAGILNEQDIMNGLETGLLNNEPLGQVLVRNGHINRNTLDIALKLQEMVDNGSLKGLDSAEVLRQVHRRGISIAQAVAELGLLKADINETIRLGELLKLAGFITEKDLQDALKLAVKNNALIGKMLLISGSIEEETLHAALRCQFLLRENFLREEQAIIALHYCQRMKCSMDEAIEELGWTVPTRTGRKSRSSTSDALDNM